MKRFVLYLSILLIILTPCFSYGEGQSNTLTLGIYNDTETGVMFKIPTGWQEATLSRNDYSSLKTKFVPADHGNAVITYLTADFWSLQPETMWAIYGWFQRKDMCNVPFSLIAAGLGMDYEMLEEKKANETTVFCFQTNVQGLVYPMKAAVFVHNGYLCLFQYMSWFDPQQDPYCTDYEALLSSITVQ